MCSYVGVSRSVACDGALNICFFGWVFEVDLVSFCTVHGTANFVPVHMFLLVGWVNQTTD
jgi:hypothetical protein